MANVGGCGVVWCAASWLWVERGRRDVGRALRRAILVKVKKN